MHSPVLEVQSLRFTYPGAIEPTIDIPSMKVPAGQTVFLFGPSGSGKTTFLELLSGVLIAQQGTVTVSGTSLGSLSPAERDRFRAEHMGYIFQSFNLLPYLDVQENIELPLRLRGQFNGEGSVELSREVHSLAASLGLESVLHQSVSRLSVGQQQRVAVARALLGRPALLLADEPTSSLDYDNREKFLKLMFQLSKERGTTVLFVSHDRSLELLFDQTLAFGDLNHAYRSGGRQ